jgi:hypothetical protein
VLVSDQWFVYLIPGILFKHDLLFLADIERRILFQGLSLSQLYC